jgi:hypothetical protein
MSQDEEAGRTLETNNDKGGHQGKLLEEVIGTAENDEQEQVAEGEIEQMSEEEELERALEESMEFEKVERGKKRSHGKRPASPQESTTKKKKAAAWHNRRSQQASGLVASYSTNAEQESPPLPPAQRQVVAATPPEAQGGGSLRQGERGATTAAQLQMKVVALNQQLEQLREQMRQTTAREAAEQRAVVERMVDTGAMRAVFATEREEALQLLKVPVQFEWKWRDSQVEADNVELLEELLGMRERLRMTLMKLESGVLFRFEKELGMPSVAFKHFTNFREVAAWKMDAMQAVIKSTVADHYMALYDAVSEKIERIMQLHATALLKIAPKKWHQINQTVHNTNQRSKLWVNRVKRTIGLHRTDGSTAGVEREKCPQQGPQQTERQQQVGCKPAGSRVRGTSAFVQTNGEHSKQNRSAAGNVVRQDGPSTSKSGEEQLAAPRQEEPGMMEVEEGEIVEQQTKPQTTKSTEKVTNEGVQPSFAAAVQQKVQQTTATCRPNRNTKLPITAQRSDQHFVRQHEEEHRRQQQVQNEFGNTGRSDVNRRHLAQFPGQVRGYQQRPVGRYQMETRAGRGVGQRNWCNYNFNYNYKNQNRSTWTPRYYEGRARIQNWAPPQQQRQRWRYDAAVGSEVRRPQTDERICGRREWATPVPYYRK